MVVDDPWIKRLSADEPERGEAIAELREVLRRGLSKSLNDRYRQPFQADDILQDALLKILGSIEQFEGRCHFIVWAMTIATRVGISALRRSYSRDVSLESLMLDGCLSTELITAHGASGANQSERSEVLKALGEVIEADLTDRQRLAIRAMLENVAVDELARKLGSQRNTIYKLVHDARSKLKLGLEQRGFTAEHVRTVFAEGSQKWR